MFSNELQAFSIAQVASGACHLTLGSQQLLAAQSHQTPNVNNGDILRRNTLRCRPHGSLGMLSKNPFDRDQLESAVQELLPRGFWPVSGTKEPNDRT